VDSSFMIRWIYMNSIEMFVHALKDIVEIVVQECDSIDAGKASKWDKDQLKNVVLPEINELLSYALKGKVLLKYGKKQRLLESSYLITDSLEGLSYTALGEKIIELQKLYNSL